MHTLSQHPFNEKNNVAIESWIKMPLQSFFMLTLIVLFTKISISFSYFWMWKVLQAPEKKLFSGKKKTIFWAKLFFSLASQMYVFAHFLRIANTFSHIFTPSSISKCMSCYWHKGSSINALWVAGKKYFGLTFHFFSKKVTNFTLSTIHQFCFF
jgi:hypothetical protein